MDCSRTKDFYKVKKRICDCHSCSDCPLCNLCDINRNIKVNCIDEAIERAQKWANNHPYHLIELY